MGALGRRLGHGGIGLPGLSDVLRMLLYMVLLPAIQAAVAVGLIWICWKYPPGARSSAVPALSKRLPIRVAGAATVVLAGLFAFVASDCSEVTGALSLE